jgi:predicted O-methyltransferase YrrM
LRLGPAVDALDKMLADGEADSYDMGFIDADKANYGNYYEKLIKLVKVGGFIVIDNTLFHGSVIDPAVSDANTVVRDAPVLD